MKITAVTRYKHGELFAALKRAGWTQAELGRRAGLHIGRVGEIINLNRRPLQKEADAIQRALGEGGEYIDVLDQWPEAFEIKRGTRKEETGDIPMESLLSCREAMMLPMPDHFDYNGIHEKLDLAMSTLAPKEKHVIEQRFYENKTHAGIAAEMKTHPGYVRTLENKALRKLRHPKRLVIIEAGWKETP